MDFVRSGRRRPRGIAAAVFGLALAAGQVPQAFARSEKTLAYPRDQAWPTAVRFLVVDEHVKVTEKDAEAGFVTFELRDEGKTFRGALEVVNVVRDGRSEVRFVLQIEDRPSWLEIAMLRRLEAKLHVELGAPAPAPDAPPEPPRDDKKDEKKDDKKDTRPAPPPAAAPRDDGGVHISPVP
ncbi:MAG TPA: hypothetical protein VFP84_14015 [Kofleriaceae bacterium]|nr:hypothetical protein [Kofleriaceae bacterium]